MQENYVNIAGRYVPRLAMTRREVIEDKVCTRFGVESETLHSRHRGGHIAKVRQLVWYILREKYSMAFATIGALYERDHTTVIHGYKKIKSKENSAFRDEISDILERKEL